MSLSIPSSSISSSVVDSKTDQDAMETKSTTPVLECCICYDHAVLPVHSCDNHIACYECLWRTTTNASAVTYDDDQIIYSTSCPSCRKNIIMIHDGRRHHHDKSLFGYPSLQGIRPLANPVLEIFFPDPIKCPFCKCVKPATAILDHVQGCGAKPLLCPREGCSHTIFYSNQPWSDHNRNICCRVKCPNCSFKATFTEVQQHARLHHVAQLVANKLSRLSDQLRHFHTSEEPEIATMLSQTEAEQRLHSISDWLGNQSHHLLQRLMTQPVHLH